MVRLETKINTAAIESELRDLEKLITKGTEEGVRQASKEAGALAMQRIPFRTGKTKARLRVTFSRRKEDFVGRVGVRAPRAHIMRFLEDGTLSHGKHGGPLPARKIMAGVKLVIEPRVPGIIDAAIAVELKGRGIQ